MPEPGKPGIQTTRSPRNREVPRAYMLAGARYARVCTLPVPLVLPVVGAVAAVR